MSKQQNSKEVFQELISSCGFVLQPDHEDFYVLQNPKSKKFITVTITKIYGTWYAKAMYWDGEGYVQVGTSHDIRIFRIHLVDAFTESGYEWPL